MEVEPQISGLSPVSVLMDHPCKFLWDSGTVYKANTLLAILSLLIQEFVLYRIFTTQEQDRNTLVRTPVNSGITSAKLW